MNTIRYDTRCYFNVCTKAGISQLNVPPGTKNKKWNQKQKSGKPTKQQKQICSEVSVNCPGNPWSQSWRRKIRLRSYGFAEKEGFFSMEWKTGVKEWRRGDGWWQWWVDGTSGRSATHWTGQSALNLIVEVDSLRAWASNAQVQIFH